MKITKYVNEYPKEFYDVASNYQSGIEERDIYEYIIINVYYKFKYVYWNVYSVFY